MHRHETSSRQPSFLIPALVALAMAAPAAADWLVTAEGEAIETDGPWQVKGRIVVFTDAKGTLSSLRLDAVDLDASEARTAGGRAAEAPKAAAAPPASKPEKRPQPRRPSVLKLTNADVASAAEDRPAVELVTQPEVVMYSTSWCGYCRRARQLLNELGVDFVEKDIEKSTEARREHTAKANGAGVPVFDFDGTIVRGYREDVLRRLATEIQTKGGG